MTASSVINLSFASERPLKEFLHRRSLRNSVTHLVPDEKWRARTYTQRIEKKQKLDIRIQTK